MSTDKEVQRRQEKLAQILREMREDTDYMSHRDEVFANRTERRPEALAYLDKLASDYDVEAFRVAMEDWSRRPGFESFGGFNGQMFLNQLVKQAGEDPRTLADLLIDTLSKPDSDEEAAQKISALTRWVEEVKKAGHPAPGRVPFFISFFWALADHEAWPPLWDSSEEMLKTLGWLGSVPTSDTVERYMSFRAVFQQIRKGDVEETESALFWLRENPFTGFAPSLLDRCEENAELLARLNEDHQYPDRQSRTIAADNARAILGEMRLVGRALHETVEEVLGRDVRVPDVNEHTALESDAPYRADGFATFAVALEQDVGAPAIRIWCTRSGVAVGVHAGQGGGSWHREIADQLAERLPPGIQFIAVTGHESGDRLRPSGEDYDGSEAFIGRWFDDEEALDRLDFAEIAVDVTRELRPLMDHICEAKGVGSGGKATPKAPPPDAVEDLEADIAIFKAERPYPRDKDHWHEEQRKELAASLTPEGLRTFDLDAFRSLINSGRYGKPGQQSHLNRTLSEADSETLQRFAESIRYLLWGDDPDPARIDRVLDQSQLGFKGLAESVIMKLLAISHPDRYLPVFPYDGDMGKRALMELIGLEPPPETELTRGELQVRSNDAIRSVLEPHLPGDPWGQGQYLYWKRVRDQEVPRGTEDVLAQLAEELLIEETFLQEMVKLLRGKGQVVLYGPPGTGKTFIARRLAQALVPDPNRRTIVQFHPSTSYEDFFEGYRPVSDGGSLTYELAQGPLARMAEKAEEAPGLDHVLVVDEINRANLPKVFGELLFLLEYRKEAVNLLYRPDELFELPENLLIIGTMNTADRSIALVDAALRRRFHFIPFFPDRSPVEGLLSRWLAVHDEPEWVADLVAMVNEELSDRLGTHLQLGPSYFMVENLEEELPRIWRYDVFPVIEEHLYGEWGEVNRYRYEQVRARFEREQPTPPIGVHAAPGDEPA